MTAPASTPCCTLDEHRRIKRTPARWLALRWHAYQDDGAGGVLEMRTCRCGSTLARRVPQVRREGASTA